MAVYFIANIKIVDPLIYQKYLDACDAVFSKYKGTYIAVDNTPRILEGSYKYSKTVIIKFENEIEFNDWYNSSEYQEIRQFRLSGAECDTILVKDIAEGYSIKRTNINDADYLTLINELNHELWSMYPNIQNEYDKLNVLSDGALVVVLYYDRNPIGCGCLKRYEEKVFEIKRVYINKNYRGKGLSRRILKELEECAVEKGVDTLILETGIKQQVAQKLYESIGYKRIENYGEYKGNSNSICMKKEIK
ncbi:GNAT family N-acetyltransferase [Sediminispirochaeta smaragdinae]|uniref:GCN5-related N-acetyltransferase n=1 Tax=Sediminispirochaeta smaragdinae (strain DSM 11293 / JCM 15392 / SEBR 4228) TaxID=573413 RepID=E1R244_SEDSS|nr:GNAT family N-acetyltransferase [Sediminispirochaeta smaragdinae]ADK81929.1 GCN5-related N-acetyltransferase [Sediminispirochaeta smaragdinae DSM 11293]